MEERDLHICRICLSTNLERNPHLLNQECSYMLQELTKTQVNVIEPYICSKCNSELVKSYTFRLKCIDNKDSIINYIHNIEEATTEEMLKMENMCGICLTTDCDFDTVNISHYLQLCAPELNVKATRDVTVCNDCCETMKCTYTFVNMCLKVDKSIASYMTANKIDEIILSEKFKTSLETDGQCLPVEVIYMDELTANVKTELVNNTPETALNVAKIEPQLQSFDSSLHYDAKYGTDLQHTESTSHCHSEELLDSSNSFINVEHSNNVISQTASQNIYKDIYLTNFDNGYHETETNNSNSTNTETSCLDFQPNINGMLPKKTYPCKKCDYVGTSREELKHHFFIHRSNCRIYKCESCPFITRHKNVIDNHNLIHMADEDVSWHYCDKCTYRSRMAANLQKHQFTHVKQTEEMKKYKCELCPYMSMWKRDLERHQVKHLNPKFSCDICSFSTRHERYLKQHVQRLHCTREETTEVFYCAQCNFSTKHKRSLIPHMVTHRNLEDLQWYKCRYCPYKAKWKRSVITHELIHVQKFNCDLCGFQTTLKRFLKEHMKGHGPMVLYKCEECDFSSHYKQSITNHRIKHKSPDELRTYQCPNCSYNTKRACDLKVHFTFMHTEATEQYKCDKCSYITRCEKRLTHHKKLVHEESGGVKKLSCSLCPFETKYKNSFVNHQITVHKLEEGPILNCPHCSYTTRRREMLQKHLVVHKSESEVEMFECYHCGYKSKYKRALIKHMERHMGYVKKDITYQCDKCDFTTKWKVTIKKHAKRHLPPVEEVKTEIEITKTEIDWMVSENGGISEV